MEISFCFTPDAPPSDTRNGIRKEQCRRFRVSSKHLALASPYFKTMLKDCWVEGMTLSTEGSASIPVKDCKPDVLLIVLNLIHGRLRQVPRKLGLQQVADIAVTTDFLQCHEVTEVFAGIWTEALKPSILDVFSEDTKKWMMIASVFQYHDILERTTRIAMQQGTAPFETNGLPIPKSIKGVFDKQNNWWT